MGGRTPNIRINKFEWCRGSIIWIIIVSHGFLNHVRLYRWGEFLLVGVPGPLGRYGTDDTLNDLLDHRREKATQHLLILIILANIRWISDFRGTCGRRCDDLLLRCSIIHQGIPEASISIDMEGAEHAIWKKLDLLSWIVTTWCMGIGAMVVEAVASDMRGERGRRRKIHGRELEKNLCSFSC